jgi:phosphate transport system substrate-binding protein
MKASTLAIVAFLAFMACADKNKKGELLDTPTAGSIRIAVDESLKPLMQAEVEAFESIYVDAHIEVVYTTEAAAVDQLLKDSVRLAVITRLLDASETHVLDTQKLLPVYEEVAHEGIALIVHPDNPDSVLQTDQLRKLLSGEITSWKDVRPKGTLTKVEVVFDQPTSGILRFLQDSLKIEKLSPQCFAVNDNPAVVEYVKSHPHAIGIIGVSWISDEDDSTSNQFLSRIRVVGLFNDSSYYQPYQAYIAQKNYPFTRKAIMVSREARTGLGSGFMAFVAGDKGQRIVLKAGLVPATMPIRIVQVSQDSLVY